MQPLVSIIIPTYNRAHLIGETLDSIIAQTYQNWECIIVDDGSRDNTDEVMAEYVAKDSRFKYHHRPKNRFPGGNAARNYGFEISKGEYIHWFDSDDLMLPEKIEIQLDILESNDSDFVVCEGSDIGSGNNPPEKRWTLQNEGNIMLNHIKGRVIFGTNGPLFKRDFLENKKLFNESIKIRQEWEFFSRLLIGKPKIDFINKTLYHYRTNTNGIRKNTSNVKKSQIIKSEYELLKVIKKEKPFKGNDIYTYKKSIYNRLKKHLPYAIQKGNKKDLILLSKSLVFLFSRKFIVQAIKNKLKSLRGHNIKS